MITRATHARYETDPRFRGLVDAIKTAFAQTSSLEPNELHDAVDLAWERLQQEKTRAMTEQLHSAQKEVPRAPVDSVFFIGGEQYVKKQQ